MKTAKEMIALAGQEIGYREKNSDANLDAKTAPNDGTGNHTKYARDLHAAGFFNGDKCGYAWCAVFVTWLMWMLCGKNKQEAMHRLCQKRDLGAGCRYAAEDYMEDGRWHQYPKVGDQVFFGPAGQFKHTGLVTGVDDQGFKTIEGNSHDRVEGNYYLLGNPEIRGFGRPIYEEENMEQEIMKALENVLGKNVQTVEELPNWAREPVRKLMDRGILQGDGNEATPDLPGGGWSLRTTVMLFRVYDVLIGKIEGLEEKIRELGGNPQV